MTSTTNTAGLEVVAWAWDHWTHLTDKWTRRATFDEPQDGSRVRNIEPLVTAASAQARIEALEAGAQEEADTLASKLTNAEIVAASWKDRAQAAEARVAELEAAKWEAQHADTINDLVAMGLARDEAEARADSWQG